MENKTLIDTNPRLAQRSMQLVLVRANGPLFYSIATASLLEALAPLYADRMRQFFRKDEVFSAWFDKEWLPRKAARAAALRQYVEKTWPELDWAAAYEQCRSAVESDGGMGPRKPTAAHEALAHCVAATQSGVFYRTVARWADDAQLREMAAGMAREEALSFGHFRTAYERRARAQRFGVISAWRTASACMRGARDLHLAVAFRALGAQCRAQVPFPVLEYPEFLTRMRAVIECHAGLGTAERILLRTWKSRPRIIKRQETEAGISRNFRPVLRAAA
jgi:hypothetical protein